MMLDRDPAKRPTAEDILSKYLLSEMEMQLKLEKQMNENLNARLANYENKLKVIRKGTF